MHSPSLAMPRAWAALLLAARWAAGSRQEDVLAVSRAAAASQELLASQPGCSEAAAGTGSTQALRSCVDSLQRYLTEVSAQSARSHTANARYAADIPAQHYDKDTATDAGSDALTSAASGSASGVGRESEEEEGEREDPTPETLAAPDVLSTTGPSVNEEAKIVKELHRETQKAASTAGRLLEAERDGEGTIQSLEADLRRKKHQLEALRAQLDEQRQAFEKAEQANYRSGNETARHRETLAKLEAENQRAHQVHAHELRKLQDLEQHAKAAADAGEAARTSAEKTVKAVTAKKDELRSAINRLNDLQDQLAELRGGSASAQAAPPQDNRSWMERILG